MILSLCRPSPPMFSILTGSTVVYGLPAIFIRFKLLLVRRHICGLTPYVSLGVLMSNYTLGFSSDFREPQWHS